MLRSRKFLLGITFFYFSCNSLKHIEGTYCIVHTPVSPDNTMLVLNDDNTFTGKSWSDIAGSFSVFGTWLRNNDTLYFKIKQPRLIDTIVYSPKMLNSAISNIQIFDAEKKKALENVNIFNGDKDYHTNKEGSLAITDPIQQDFLIIEYMGVKDSISKKELMIGELKIFFNFKNLQTFNVAQKWIIKKKKIIPLERGYSVFKKCNRNY